MTDRLIIKLKEKENALHCVYLNDFNMVIAAFILQCSESKNWHDGISKARHVFMKLKQGTFVDAQGHVVKIPLHQQQQQQQQQQHQHMNNFNVPDNISIKKSPLGSSIGKSAHTDTHAHIIAPPGKIQNYKCSQKRQTLCLLSAN
jgi:hypothetical protein